MYKANDGGIIMSDCRHLTRREQLEWYLNFLLRYKKELNDKIDEELDNSIEELRMILRNEE
jgi:hypothetical protein